MSNFIDPTSPLPSFAGSVTWLMEKLEDIHRTTDQKRTFDELCDGVHEKINRGYIAFDLVKGYVVDLDGKRNISYFIEISVAYCVTATLAYNSDGIESAFPLLTHAYLFMGRALQWESLVSGGLETAKQYDPFYSEIETLLHLHCPPGGWEFVDEAVLAIRPHFLTYCENLPPSKQVLKDPEGTLSMWSKDTLRSVFLGFAKQFRIGRPKRAKSIKQRS